MTRHSAMVYWPSATQRRYVGASMFNSMHWDDTQLWDDIAADDHDGDNECLYFYFSFYVSHEQSEAKSSP